MQMINGFFVDKEGLFFLSFLVAMSVCMYSVFSNLQN
jgi:hypothetical protein